jgi:hypothetical protein
MLMPIGTDLSNQERNEGSRHSVELPLTEVTLKRGHRGLSSELECRFQALQIQVADCR